MTEENEVITDSHNVAIAKAIVAEEAERLEQEMLPDIKVLMDSWVVRIAERINARLEKVGVGQILEIGISWDPENLPTLTFTGATEVEESDD